MMNKNWGYGLSELMIALGISSLLTLSLASFFKFYQENYDALQRKEKNFHEMILLKTYLQDLYIKSDFYGCYTNFSKTEAIFSKETPGIPRHVARKITKNSKGIRFYFQEPKALSVVLPLLAGSEVVHLAKAQKLKVNQTLVFSDCQHLETSKVIKIEDNGRRITIEPALQNNFKQMTHVSIKRELHLFVGVNSQNEKALYISENHQSEALVNNVRGLDVGELGHGVLVLSLERDKIKNDKSTTIFLRKMP